MLALNMICMACGCRGPIGSQEVFTDNSRPDCFKYWGHNPFTGSMHYQCPECNSYLNIDPMDILRMDPARGRPNPGCSEKDTYRILVDTADALLQLPVVIKGGVLWLTRYITKIASVSL